MKSYLLSIIACLFTTVIVNAQMKIHTGGNISIGSIQTPASGFKIQIVGNSLFSGSTGTLLSSAYIRGLNTYSTALTPDYTWWGNDQTGIFHPQFNTIGFSIGGTEMMRLQNDGSISIGRNYMNNSMLYVYSNRNGGGTNSSSPIFSETNHTIDYGWNIVAKVNRSTTKCFVVEQNGNHNFWVLGDGHLVAKSMSLSSDEKLKTNIQDFTNTDKLYLLKPKSYIFKDVKNGNTEYGFLAQDVQKEYPELVYTDEKGLLSINYIAFVPMLVQAVQQQKAQINLLQQQIDQCCTKKSAVRLDNSSNDAVVLKNVLYQNYPNPFSENTYIKYSVSSEAQEASLYVFDMQGTFITSYSLQKGNSEITINGGDLKAGMYIYSLIVDNVEIDTKRMILTK